MPKTVTRRQTAQDAPQRAQSLAPVVKSLVALEPRRIDVRALQAIVGDVTLPTLKDVGTVFGVGATTVRQAWRQNGMPDSDGQWKLLPILAWRLQRNLDNSEQQQRPADDERELRCEGLRLDNERKQRDLDEAAGRLIDADVVTATLNALIASLAKRLQQLPDDVAPQLPQELAPAVIETLRRAIDRQLTGFAETAADSVATDGAELWQQFTTWLMEQNQCQSSK